MPTLAPATAAQVVEVVAWALRAREALAVEGRGSKRGFGYPVASAQALSMRDLAGIIDYQPAELVMVARPGTPLPEIEAALAASGQQLAFEPPHLGSLYGGADVAGSIGGAFLGNLAGPRRFRAGSARDHLLGFSAVNGRAEAYRAGGAVIKNVTGYDLAKLVCGSWGTLSIVTELTFRVVPEPAHAATLVFAPVERPAAHALLRALAASAVEASGLAWLPAGPVAGAGGPAVIARLEGSGVAVAEGRAELARVGAGGAPALLEGEASRTLWRAVRDVAPLRATAQDAVIRVSAAPATVAALGDWFDARAGRRWFLDAGGGNAWLALPAADAPSALPDLRARIAGQGSVVLYAAPADCRIAAGVLTAPAPALARLAGRVKSGFDPHGLFNPGRLYPAH